MCRYVSIAQSTQESTVACKLSLYIWFPWAFFYTFRSTWHTTGRCNTACRFNIRNDNTRCLCSDYKAHKVWNLCELDVRAILIKEMCDINCGISKLYESSRCNRSREMAMLFKNFCKIHIEQCNLTRHLTSKNYRVAIFLPCAHCSWNWDFKKVMLWKINMRNIYVLRALFYVEDNKYLVYLLENFISRKNHFQQQIPDDRRIDDDLYWLFFESFTLEEWLDNKT